MVFQEKLQALRREKGLSQEMLAESIGLSRQAVAKWEAGQSTPDIDNLIALSDYFKVSIDRLIRDEKDGCFWNEDRPAPFVDEGIIAFLCRAKRATYAGHGPETAPTRPFSHDAEYAEGSLRYIDTYIGGEKFAGEEGLWRDGVPFWSMNYCGRVLGEGFSGDFLKEALANVPQEYPYRGPMVYENGEFKYHCIVEGSFEWYRGYDEIFLNGRKVYECMFHGGCIK